MATFPVGVYSPRTKSNKVGVIYNPDIATTLYAQDITLLDAEVVAIENLLQPKAAAIGALLGVNTGDQDITGLVAKSLFDANSILYATTDDTPVALTVSASTIVGRKSTGAIVALSATEVKTILAIAQADVSGLTTESSPTFVNVTTSGNIELGHASDTTIARVSAGLVSIEGSNILTALTGAAIAQTFYIGTTQVAINRGSGALTLAGITLTTPNIGTPSAGKLTNCTELPVAGAGTGRASHTAYALIAGGISTTGAQQSIANSATVGAILLGAGTSVIPAFSTTHTINANSLVAGSGKGMPDFIVLPVQSAKIGHLGATAASIDGSLNRWYVNFDPATDWFVDYQFLMPFTYNTNQTLTVKLMWISTVASNNVVWNASLMAMTSGDAALLETDSFDTTNAVTTAASGTAGRPVTSSITMTTKDSVEAGDIVTLRISRDADNAGDTNTGIAKLAGLILEWN